MAAVDLLLRAAGLERRQLDGIAATRGPGSFTGVRVALATASGLALALRIPAFGFSSLLAQAARTDLPAVIAVQPARRGFVYAQAFVRGEGRLSPSEEPRVAPLAALVDSAVPVVGAADLALPPGTPQAPTRCGAAEALLTLLGEEAGIERGPLVPVYLEPPPAVPHAHRARPWPPSPKVS
jgi:tRNA threonylcarbamoyl adenosine modification protein YeaZ